MNHEVGTAVAGGGSKESSVKNAQARGGVDGGAGSNGTAAGSGAAAGSAEEGASADGLAAATTTDGAKPTKGHGTGLGRWVKRFEESAPYIATTCVLAIAALTLKAQGQVKDWAREVVEREVVQSPDYRRKFIDAELNDAPFLAKVDERVEKLPQRKDFWDKVELAAREEGGKAAVAEVNKQDADRVLRLVNAMLDREDFRAILVGRFSTDQRLRQALVREIVRDPVAFGALRGPKGDLGPRGDAGPRGDSGARGDVGPTGERGLRGEQGPKGDAGPRGEPGAPGVCACPDAGATAQPGPK